jgi:phosphonatase-like hydrolase
VADFRPALVACDLGGTTVHDRGEVPAAFADALREAGVPFDPSEVAAWRGASKREVLGRLVAREDGSSEQQTARVEQVFGRFRVLLSEQLARAGPLSLPGVYEAFEQLRARGMRLAITTGFDRGLTEQILRSVEWAPLVHAAICSDDVTQGRPAPYMIFQAMERCGVHDVRRVAVVGDTRLDLEAGWNAGAEWRIGVLTGAHDLAALVSAPSTRVVGAVTELPGLWAAP